MTTVSYSDIYAQIQGLAGVSSFTAQEQTNILGFVNRRIYQAYAASPCWPRYYVFSEARPAQDGLINREFTVTGPAVTAATRVAGVVTLVLDAESPVSPGMNYHTAGLTGTVSIGIGTTLTCTSLDTTTIANDTVIGTIATTNTGSETYSGAPGTFLPDSILDIEQFYRIFDNNRTAVNQAVREYDYTVGPNGAIVSGVFSGLTGFWVSYKSSWSGPYSTSSANIPQEFEYYVAHAAYADFLRMDAQIDKAMAEEQNAQQYLIIELDRAELQANAQSFTRISTYTSRAAR